MIVMASTIASLASVLSQYTQSVDLLKKTSAASHSTFLVCMHLEGTISKFSAWVVALHYEHTITFILIQNYNITTPASWPDHFKNACYGLEVYVYTCSLHHHVTRQVSHTHMHTHAAVYHNSMPLLTVLRYLR